MPYTRLAKPPSTRWARHLDVVRLENGWSATQMFEDAYGPLGLGPKSLTSFKPILMDKEPPSAWVSALTARYGAPPKEEAAAVDTVAASDQRALASALQALADELKALRAERTGLVDRVTDLENTVAVLSRQSVEGTSAQTARDVPRG